MPQLVRKSDSVSEPQRLAEIERLGLLYTPAEECFDRVTRLASRIFAAPIAMISIVGDRNIWLKSRVGIELSEVGRDDGFASLVIQSNEPLVVPDALADPRFARCKLVADAPFARFYAGVAVRSPDGAKVGALGVIDTEPRHMADQEISHLRDLAAIVEDEFQRRHLSSVQSETIRELGEVRRRSMVDTLTSAWNRAGLDMILQREMEAAEQSGQPLAVAMVDLDHFKQVNDKYGHSAGDAVLSEVSRRLRVAARPNDSVTRFGGEEFVIVLPDCGDEHIGGVGERLRKRISGTPIVVGESVSINLTCSIGIAVAQPGEQANLLLTRADVALYDAKHDGRNRVATAGPSRRVATSTIHRS